jgi:DNA polymerase-3 subunit epsilon
MKNLKLVKPIIFIDLETTGLNPWADRIVEATFLKFYPDGNSELVTKLINPEVPIPEDATAIHGITDSDVVGKPNFGQYSAELAGFIADCDIAGFNVKRFDLPFLETEFRRAGVDFSRQNRFIVDALVIYHKFEQRSLEAAYQRYCGKELSSRHSSLADAKATVEILDAQISLYAELPKDVCGLHEFCCDPGESNFVDKLGNFIIVEDEITFNFGKHKGERLKDVAESAPDYLDWILHKSDFSLEVQEIVLRALND